MTNGLMSKLRGSKAPSLPGAISSDPRWLQFEQRRLQLEAAATATREQIERAQDARTAAVAALTEDQVQVAMAIGLDEDSEKEAAKRADRAQQTIADLDRELVTLRGRLEPQQEAVRRYLAGADALRQTIAADQRKAIHATYMDLTAQLAKQLEVAAPINRQLLELRAKFPEATAEFAFLDVLPPLVIAGPNAIEVWRRAIGALGITCDL